MKVGIIRCMQTEDFCPGTTDFKLYTLGCTKSCKSLKDALLFCVRI